MKYLLIVILSLLPIGALAQPQITITLSGAGEANTSKSLTLSIANGTRVLNWAKSAYGLVIVEAPKQTDRAICEAEPIPADCKPVTRELTNKEAVDRLFQGFLNDIRDKVLQSERSQAARTAREAVSPIEP